MMSWTMAGSSIGVAAGFGAPPSPTAGAAPSTRRRKGPLTRRIECPEVKAPVRHPAPGVVAALAEFFGAPPPRAFNLPQKAEPDLQEINRALPRCSTADFSDGVLRPNLHGDERSPLWLRSRRQDRRQLDRIPAAAVVPRRQRPGSMAFTSRLPTAPADPACPDGSSAAP